MLSLLRQEYPLQIIGCLNAYVAIMAKRAGYRALYLSGAGVSNNAFGVPDIGAITLPDLREEARRITRAVSLPLLVDIDTGYEDPEKTVFELEKVGVKGVHIEDQLASGKKCGHLENKKLIPKEEMAKRIRAAVRGKRNPDFCVIARCDAPFNEMPERLALYKEAGADAFFPEALADLSDYRRIKEQFGLPVLANMTEFGKTPIADLRRLREAGVDMALYPLSVARAMNRAALEMLFEIRQKGTQRGALEKMQTREELYHILGYEV